MFQGVFGIDLLNRLTGVDTRDAFANALHIDIDGLSIAVLALDDLIDNKRSTGRTQDLVDAERLEALRDQDGSGRDPRPRD